MRVRRLVRVRDGVVTNIREMKSDERFPHGHWRGDKYVIVSDDIEIREGFVYDEKENAFKFPIRDNEQALIFDMKKKEDLEELLKIKLALGQNTQSVSQAAISAGVQIRTPEEIKQEVQDKLNEKKDDKPNQGGGRP